MPADITASLDAMWCNILEPYGRFVKEQDTLPLKLLQVNAISDLTHIVFVKGPWNSRRNESATRRRQRKNAAGR